MWLTDYLLNRTQAIQCNGFFLEVVPICFRIPQGSIISPFLFIILFKAAYNVLKHSNFIKYADDTVMYMSSSSLDKIGLSSNLLLVSKFPEFISYFLQVLVCVLCYTL